MQILQIHIDTGECCTYLGLSRSTYYSWISGKDPNPAPKPRKPYEAAHILSESERRQVLGLMNSDAYVDKTPYEVFYTELDQGNYYCSIRSIYRILSANQMVTERRRGHQQRNYTKPELLAEAPNQIWSWDITKLKGPIPWSYYYLYVILDIYSRYIVGWLIAETESAELAKELISESCKRHNIKKKQLTIHSDNGSPMKSKTPRK